MATFLFWNMGKKALKESLFRLATLHQVDVLILAECALSPGEVLEELNREKTIYFFPNTDQTKAKIQIFTRFDKFCLRHHVTSPSSRWTFRRLMLPNKPEVLLVGVHLNAQKDGKDHFLGTDGRIRGTPKNRWPDHLPIVFKLDI